MLKRFIFFISAIVIFSLSSACCLAIQNCRSQVLKTDNIINIPNFRKINDNLYAGSRPGEKGVGQLAQTGIKTIVDLERGLFEEEPEVVKREEKWAKKVGIRFLRVPMRSFFLPGPEEVDKALSLITDPNNKPVFVHCGHGKDRTGIVIAAYRIKINGWSPEQAYKEMNKYGFHWYLFWWKSNIFRYAKGQIKR